MNQYTQSSAINRLILIKDQLLLAKTTIIAYFTALMVVAICTVVGNIFFLVVDHSNLIMLYLLGVVFVATSNHGRQGPAILAALLSTLAFDFFFIPPFLSFNVSDIQYFFTLMVMLVISQTISHLTIRVQRHVEAIRHAKIKAETEQLRNIFLTSISHDMRTPLTIIMGSASTLLQPEKISAEMHKELARNIYDESKRLNNIVVNVLQIIRLESGAIKLAKQLHSLENIFNNVLERLTEELQDHPVRLQIAKDIPLIPLDHILIEQVMMNLIENAIKYSKNNTPIDISARSRGKSVLIKVADKGKGIEPHDLENIFNKFYRANNKSVTSDEGPDNECGAGFGLGLAICKHIIQAHGGKIWAENDRNGGALFYFTLPLPGESCS